MQCLNSAWEFFGTRLYVKWNNVCNNDFQAMAFNIGVNACEVKLFINSLFNHR